MSEKPTDPASEKLEGALKLIVEGIKATLDGDRPGRFADAIRLCNIGQSLVRTTAKRVKDFAVLEVDDEDVADDEIRAAGGLRVMNQGGALIHHAQGPVDQNELMRNFMLTFGPNAQIQAEAQRASVAAQEAAELQALLRSSQDLSQGSPARQAVERRIEALVANMEARSDVKSDVVSSDVSRGHPTGEEGAGGDGAPGVRADANGGGGNGHLAGARHQEGAGAEAVGHG